MAQVQPDATGRQKTVIAQLCMALKVQEHLEEKPMSKGEAGRLIRKLSENIKAKNSRRHTKKPN